MSDHRRHWTLQPELAYLNHGSFGACPAAVLEYQAELRARLERQPMQFMARDLESMLDEARGSLADFLGAREQDLVFVSNATSGVNAVLRSLSLESGQGVLTTNLTYPACRHALDWVCERAGAEVQVADIPLPVVEPQQLVEAVLARVTPTTKLALLDHVTSSTGLVFPIHELVRALEERGVPTLVDGAHAPGMLALNLQELRPAYYTGNCHKWLCAPKGAAFLWVREDLHSEVVPNVISHGLHGLRKDRLLHDRFDWVGTDDPTAFLCVPRCLDFLGGLLPGGWPALREANHRLVVQGRKLLLTALGSEPLCPDSMLGSLASMRIDGPKPEGWDPLQRRLLEEHDIEVQVTYGPFRILRISAQIYNDTSEYERLANALTKCYGSNHTV